MKQITLTMEESLYNFYKKVGQQAGGLSPEKVMSDALFKLAGELASVSYTHLHDGSRFPGNHHAHPDGLLP